MSRSWRIVRWVSSSSVGKTRLNIRQSRQVESQTKRRDLDIDLRKRLDAAFASEGLD